MFSIGEEISEAKDDDVILLDDSRSQQQKPDNLENKIDQPTAAASKGQLSLFSLSYYNC